MQIIKMVNTDHLSNSYLIVSDLDDQAILIDAGADFQVIDSAIKETQAFLRAVFVTHHHPDHVAAISEVQYNYHVPVYAHKLEIPHIVSEDIHEIDPDALFSFGDIRIDCLHVPGHTPGHMAYQVCNFGCFTGDTLFKGSVGGTMSSAFSNFSDLKRSLMNKLMKLPMSLRVYPGHTESSTIRDEWEENRFIRAFREIDPLENRNCVAMGRKAELRVITRGYDGGTKAWVKFIDNQQEAIVPGSSVKF